MKSAFKVLYHRINNSKIAEELFGVVNVKKDDITKMYREWAFVVHPDRNANSSDSKNAFAKLNVLHDEAVRRLDLGIYGKPDPIPAPPPTPEKMRLKIGKRELVFDSNPIFKGDLAELYAGELEDVDHPVLVKASGHPSDNDLLENESKFLKTLSADSSLAKRYVPKLHDTFVLKGKKTRRLNVMKAYHEHFSLADVLHAYPNGLDFRDAAWMLRRVMEGLVFIHSHGVVHAALVPEHVLVHPVRHDAKIIDWCYAKEVGQTVVAIVPNRKDWYPPEVLDKRQVDARTDVFMLGKTALRMFDNLTPYPIVRFFHSILAKNPNMRSTPVMELYDEFAELLERLVGKPSYRPFAMPPAP